MTRRLPDARGRAEQAAKVAPFAASNGAKVRKSAAGDFFQLSSAHVDVQKRVRTWSPRRTDIAAWTNAALGRRARNRELNVRVVGRTESRRLNAHYRGKDYATNVLSFPAPPLPTRAARGDDVRALGDLVICPQVLQREAREQNKRLRAHWAHLVIHGALHLIGYDHERSADARRMERREIAVLRELGFENPYRSTR